MERDDSKPDVVVVVVVRVVSVAIRTAGVYGPAPH
jgi:hypothetical protein